MTASEIHAKYRHVFVFEAVPPKTSVQGRRFNPKTGRTYKPGALKEAESDYLTLLHSQRPESPIEGPIELCLLAVWPYRKSDSSTRALAELCETMSGRRCTVKPDSSNFAKIIEDALVKLSFIKDDAEVSDLHVHKMFGKVPGVIIGINTLKEWL